MTTRIQGVLGASQAPFYALSRLKSFIFAKTLGIAPSAEWCDLKPQFPHL